MRWLMTFLLVPVLLAGLDANAQDRRARSALLDRIVAVVNNEVITRSELDERIRIALQQLRAQREEPPPAEILERQVLDRMIADRAQLQFAKESGITVDNNQIDRSVERVAAANKVSLAEFRRALERDGISMEQLREDLRTELLLQRLREREVDSKIQVSETDIDNFLAEGSNTAEAKGPVEWSIAHILVRVPENASDDQLTALQGKARQALEQVRGGTVFAKVAESFSDAEDAKQGGAMGWRTRERIPELFADAADKLKRGEVSDILRSPAGFHIIQLVDRRGVQGDKGEVEQTRVRHILVRANESVSESEARRRIDRLRQRIVIDGQAFEEIARFNSEDASAARGGELGWVLPGDTVPEFEGAMKALKPNELSEPVRSPFGWHLIQVMERRTGDVGADRRRLEARRVLRERRSDEAYEEWVRQLRDRAYVELRLDER